MSLFSDTDKEVRIDPEKNYLEELVGEGRVYKDPEALARGAAEKEAFILRLQNENKGLRDELSTRTRMEELVDKLATPVTKPAEPQVPQEPTPSVGTALTPQNVQEMLEEHDRKRVAKNNVDQVKTTLRSQWGENFATKLREQAETLGVGLNFLDSIAESNPQAFYRLVGLNMQRSDTASGVSMAPPRSQVNTTTFRPSNVEKRNYQYYESMRKNSDKNIRDRYWTAQVQNEMHRIASENPEAFFAE